MTLSIIIPAFDEARKIQHDVHAAAAFLLAYDLAGEVIVVDDGSSDGTADAAGACAVPPGVDKTIITGNGHRGKGFAVRTGILASRGEYVLFADSGTTVPFQNALGGMQLLRARQCDLAHGSRRLPGSTIVRGQDWDRKFISRVFQWIVVRWMHLPTHLTDTQCGFKIYRGESARMLYADCITDGFMFDIEVILRAQQKGLRILEFPVEWTCDRDSRIGFRNSPPVLRELSILRRTLFRRS